jgi:hypothetical protein
MPNISEIADNYQKEFGFMAVNATKRAALMFHSIHDDVSVAECRLVHDELLRRGVKVVVTKAQYEALVAQHGVPPGIEKLGGPLNEA